MPSFLHNGVQALGLGTPGLERRCQKISSLLTEGDFSSCENVRLLLSSSRRTDKTRFVNAAPFTRHIRLRQKSGMGVIRHDERNAFVNTGRILSTSTAERLHAATATTLEGTYGYRLGPET